MGGFLPTDVIEPSLIINAPFLVDAKMFSHIIESWIKGPGKVAINSAFWCFIIHIWPQLSPATKNGVRTSFPGGSEIHVTAVTVLDLKSMEKNREACSNGFSMKWSPFESAIASHFPDGLNDSTSTALISDGSDITTGGVFCDNEKIWIEPAEVPNAA